MSCRKLLPITVCVLLLGVLVPAAGATTFRPRIDGALGLEAPFDQAGRALGSDPATASATPALYHGGAVMSGGVTVHTIFWAPDQSMYEAGYVTEMEKFFTDVGADSGLTSNIFSVLNQYGSGTAPGGGLTDGSYDISYSDAAGPGDDAVVDTDGYPARADQCASAENTATCITDGQIQTEVQNVIGNDSENGGRSSGMHDLWIVFLPAGVDECVVVDVCGTNDFAAYHGASAASDPEPTMYAVSVDPSIEGQIDPGHDPEGIPDADAAVSAIAHETVEAMTDPEGTAWYTPNGFEIADMCESGPQYGPFLGTAANGSPYNEVINGDEWLIQEMWDNVDKECAQKSTATSAQDGLPLPQISLTQYSSTVSGNTENGVSGNHVSVELVRSDVTGNPITVASASTTTASGSWTVSLSPYAVGDDRDEIVVDYMGTDAPEDDVIMTGNGGDPFEDAGWTGWMGLDDASYATNHGGIAQQPQLTVTPCFESGVLTFTGPTTITSQTLNDLCGTQTNTSTVDFSSSVAPSNAITLTSSDNRGYGDVNDSDDDNAAGALVSLTVPVGEADAVSSYVSPVGFEPSGLPSCAVDLELQTVTCTGLVAQESYTAATTGHNEAENADDSGTAVFTFPSGALVRGNSVTLSNGSRTLTAVSIAHLRVDIAGQQSVLSGGTCQPGEYYGAPLGSVPTSSGPGEETAVGGGAALTGEICPIGGGAAGLPSTDIAQTDDASGGQTQTEVPDIEDTSPMEGETVYGSFIVLAESGLPAQDDTVFPTDSTSKVAVSIAPAGGGSAVFSNTDVDTANGANVTDLPTGTYEVTWKLTDANGDTRTVTTRFVEESGTQGAQGQTGAPGATGAQGKTGPDGKTGPQGPPGPKPKISCKLMKHNKIVCKVSYPKTRHGKLQLEIARGSKVAALGHADLRRGKATVILRERRQLKRGRWTITLVLSRSHKEATTTTVGLRMR
jgi:hypothetical protein